MTVCDGALQRLVLASCGDQHHVGSLIDAVAPVLAGALGLPVQHAADPLDPVASLSRLAPLPPSGVAAPDSWLLALPIDPGQALSSGGHWAESLGAWRLPVLLVLGSDHLASGWPAAADALLRRWRVPVAGLLQWGGSWDGPARRRDGLPWLGRAERADDELRAAIVHLRHRWAELAEH